MKSKYEVKVGFAGALLMAMNDGSANSTRFDIPEALGPSLSENFSSNGRLSSLRLPPSPFEDLPVDIFVANVCHKMNFTGFGVTTLKINFVFSKNRKGFLMVLILFLRKLP
eukprot:GHVP01053991.1.p1 GENE.GHVP01053991.1~~GHVP01053991.1.p1  ORF type:complete len:123 (+),score=18.33 GHVP01053991.1:39-371(+)